MLAKIYSAAVYGVDAYEVEIEMNAAGGLPVVVIVGLPDTAVKESKDRVTTAIANSGYYWPRGRTTVNLAPADIKKEGPSFDLPIALGISRAARRWIRRSWPTTPSSASWRSMATFVQSRRVADSD